MTARVLPITVLAWEGPQARAYLARLARDELRPERIVLMVRDPLGGALRRVPGSDVGPRWHSRPGAKTASTTSTRIGSGVGPRSWSQPLHAGSRRSCRIPSRSIARCTTGSATSSSQTL